MIKCILSFFVLIEMYEWSKAFGSLDVGAENYILISSIRVLGISIWRGKYCMVT